MLKRIFLSLMRHVAERRNVSPDYVDWKKFRRILVIRQHDQLGDFLLATPVFRAIKENLPECWLGVVARDYFSETLKHHPHVDEVIEIPKRLTKWSPKRIADLIKQIRAEWDLVIVLSTVSHSLTSDVLAWMSGAAHVLGSEAHPFPGHDRNFFYNLAAPVHPGLRHQSERNLDIIRYVGINTTDLSEQIRITTGEIDAARSCVRNMAGGDIKGHLIGFHIGAGKIANRWPIASFASLIQKSNTTFDATSLVFWGPNENALSEELRSMVGSAAIFVPPSSLRILAAYFAICNVAVCNDTGAMHLCAAVGTPMVVPFGPTRVEEWKPVGQQFVGLQGRDGNVTAVRVDEVFEKMKDLIRGT